MNTTFDLKHVLDTHDIQALIFDMDGTLIDNMGFHRLAWIEWARREGLPYSEAEILTKTHGTIGEIVRRLFPDQHDPAQLHAIGERKEALYRELYRPHLQLLPGLTELLQTAQAQGLPMGLATAGDRKNIDFTLDGLQVRPYFKALIGGEEVRHGKPHPEVFLLAAQELGTAPEKCLVFEDSRAGVEAAQRAGMPCLVVNPMEPRPAFGPAPHVLHFAPDYSTLLQQPNEDCLASPAK